MSEIHALADQLIQSLAADLPTDFDTLAGLRETQGRVLTAFITRREALVAKADERSRANAARAVAWLENTMREHSGV